MTTNVSSYPHSTNKNLVNPTSSTQQKIDEKRDFHNNTIISAMPHCHNRVRSRRSTTLSPSTRVQVFRNRVNRFVSRHSPSNRQVSHLYHGESRNRLFSWWHPYTSLTKNKGSSQCNEDRYPLTNRGMPLLGVLILTIEPYFLYLRIDFEH